MKRLILGLCILALLPLGAVSAQTALDARLTEISLCLDDPALAAALWQSARPLAASLTDHARLQEIDLAFAALQESLGSPSQVQLLLRSLAESEKPFYYNFL